MGRANYQKYFTSNIEIGIPESKPKAVQPHKKDFGWNISKPIWRELTATPAVVDAPSNSDGAGLTSQKRRQQVGRDRATEDRATYLEEMSHTFSLGEIPEKLSAREETVRRIASAPHPHCSPHTESEDSPWAPNAPSEPPSSPAGTKHPSNHRDGAAGSFYGSGPCAAMHASDSISEPLEPLYAVANSSRVPERRRDYHCPVRSAEHTELGARKVLHESGHLHALRPQGRR